MNSRVGPIRTTTPTSIVKPAARRGQDQGSGKGFGGALKQGASGSSPTEVERDIERPAGSDPRRAARGYAGLDGSSDVGTQVNVTA